MFSNSPKRSFEIVDLVSCGKEAESPHVLDEKTPSVQGIPEPTPGDEPFIGTSKTRKYEYIDLDSEETRKKFLSANSINEKGENGYRGKYLKGKVVEKIGEEISRNLKGNSIKSMRLLVGRKSGKPEITARTVLDNYKTPISISDLLKGEMCKKYNIKAITFLLPDQDEKRGIRCRLGEDGTRIYEVANGSYDMTLNWYVEGKECKMKINISDDGSVKFIESNGVTWEQLAAHKEVKVGRQYEAKPLYEALSYLRRENSEIVEFSQQPSTSVTPPTKVEGVKKTQEEKQKDTAQWISR
ncbi:uncharacterized protein TNCV_1354571 [Trichonephila clavipes]|uniref:Uncharacterized protein n=1 Tax=Trichonephila clavipes TaxID=2585209 RepID=A0A8X6SB77_TRICX|nr:uncharacterized protein TNCV_1354571 [Trichonephila clavipes]